MQKLKQNSVIKIKLISSFFGIQHKHKISITYSNILTKAVGSKTKPNFILQFNFPLSFYLNKI